MHVWLRAIRERVGGASRDRTGDLLLAKQALSQLSYGPAGAECTGGPRDDTLGEGIGGIVARTP